jgi:retinol dehydrogenase 12
MILNSKTVIITGSTSGIGTKTAVELARMGANLVLPVRNISKGQDLRKEIIEKTQNDRVEIMECDLASLSSIRKFVTAFKERHNELHILINNAGIWETSYQETVDGIEQTFAVNHLAPFLLTNLLLDIMKQSAPGRIINVSSEAHRGVSMNLKDLEGKNGWNSFTSYGRSKLANILFTKKLAEILADKNITVNCLHPGVVATKLFDKFPGFLVKTASLFLLTPEKGAKTTIFLASSDEVEKISGKYFSKSKIKSPSSAAKDIIVADELWNLSLEMTGLKKDIHEKEVERKSQA